MSRVLVLGAGVAGIASAWYLAAGGAEVIVIERGAEPASETSHANGCHLSTQSGTPWMGPAGLREFMTTRLARERPVRILRARDPGRWRWFVRALAASSPSRYAHASAAIARLARFSRETLELLMNSQNLDIGFEAGGVLALYRNPGAFDRARNRLTPGSEVLSGDEVLRREPALATANVRPAGAVLYPGDATADCRRFCMAMAARAASSGVEFRYRTAIESLVVESGRCRGVRTSDEIIEAEDCVVALGAGAAPLLRREGLRLPILSLRGYTLSVPIDEQVPAPRGFVDAERRVVFAHLGNVFRGAGMADFAGNDLTAPPRRIAQLDRVAADWYPPVARANVEHWTCLRPMTPDGPPILGASPIAGLWLDVGLGPLGWTLGPGAGRLLADLILGRPAALPLDGLDARRFLN